MQPSIDIPSPSRADTETVITALETAAVFLAKGDEKEAMRWLRRAAESAADSGDDERALALSRVAAELQDELSAVQMRPSAAPKPLPQAPTKAPYPSPPSVRPPPAPSERATPMSGHTTSTPPRPSQAPKAAQAPRPSQAPKATEAPRPSQTPRPSQAPKASPSQTSKAQEAPRPSQAPRPSYVGSRPNLSVVPNPPTETPVPKSARPSSAPPQLPPPLPQAEAHAAAPASGAHDSVTMQSAALPVEPTARRESVAPSAITTPLPSDEAPAPASASAYVALPSTGARHAARVAVTISTTKAGVLEVRLLKDDEAPRLGASEALLVMMDPTSTLLAR